MPKSHAAYLSRASHPPLCSCSWSGRCWASGWARNGRLVRRWLCFWPARSRGFMSGVLQGSWGLGFALSAAAYGLLYTPLENWHKGYGWRVC